MTAVIEAFGRAFVENRYIGIVWLVLPVIGLLERSGLRERAQTLIGAMRTVTTPGILLVYLLLRQITAAEERHGTLSEADRMAIRAHAAAAELRRPVQTRVSRVEQPPLPIGVPLPALVPRITGRLRRQR